MTHTYVGTEHLLIGLAHEETGVAAEILIDLGLAVETLTRQCYARHWPRPTHARRRNRHGHSPTVFGGTVLRATAGIMQHQ